MSQIVDDGTIELTEKQWDNLAWRLAEYGTGPLWNPLLPLDRRLAFLDVLRRLQLRISEKTPTKGGGVYMFWDNLLDKPLAALDLAMSEADALKMVAPIDAAIFDILVELVEHPNEYLREGALHGLSHLDDPRGEAVIAAVGQQQEREEAAPLPAAQSARTTSDRKRRRNRDRSGSIRRWQKPV